MTDRKKALKILKYDLKHAVSNEELERQHLDILSFLYEERYTRMEREKKVMLTKLLEVTKGKQIIIKSNSKTFKQAFLGHTSKAQ
ncbi:MAG: hypothetical protein CFE21_08730 [Bacteroidetes bacterium B1(2017)]|nr:MAG: hypothetical protein CFE21_08730 [Bacteroidetes bacterium B1(2017)]